MELTKKFLQKLQKRKEFEERKTKILIALIEPSEKTKQELNYTEKYHIYANLFERKIECDCMGYIAHKHCKHSEKYQKFWDENNLWENIDSGRNLTKPTNDIA